MNIILEDQFLLHPTETKVLVRLSQSCLTVINSKATECFKGQEQSSKEYRLVDITGISQAENGIRLDFKGYSSVLDDDDDDDNETCGLYKYVRFDFSLEATQEGLDTCKRWFDRIQQLRGLSTFQVSISLCCSSARQRNAFDRRHPDRK
jgi:hypothetical protein